MLTLVSYFEYKSCAILEASLRTVGQTDRRTDGHETDALDVARVTIAAAQLVQSLRGSPCAKNVREVSLHFHELDHVA